MSSNIAFNNYRNLPGHLLGFKDKQIKLPRAQVNETTESVVFVGTAADGPVLEPIQVTPDNVYAIFGNAVDELGAWNGTNLVLAFEEAWQTGARDIRLMRYSGKTAKAEISAISRQEPVTDVRVEEITVRGNAETTFAVESMSIDEASVIVRVAGQVIPSEFVTVLEDVDRTFFTIQEDKTIAGAEVTVSYSYPEMDGEGNVEVFSMIDRNYDFDNALILTSAFPVELELISVPQGVVRVYVGNVEVPQEGVFTLKGKEFSFDLEQYPLSRGSVIRVSYTYTDYKEVTPKILLETTNAGAIYNQFGHEIINDADGNNVLLIYKPNSKKVMSNELPIKLSALHYSNLGLLANAINSHPHNNGLIRATVTTGHENISMEELVAHGFANFTEGSDEADLNNDQIFERLSGVRDEEGYIVTPGAYQTLENYIVDYVVPLGVYADTKLSGLQDNFAYQLAMACAVMSHYNSVTLGIIGTSPVTNPTLRGIEEHVRMLEDTNINLQMKDARGNVITNQDGVEIDLGQFIGIFAGPDLVSINTRLGEITTGTPAGIAGLVSSLDIGSSLINKRLPAAQGIRYELSQSQLDRLAGKGFINVRRQPDGEITIVDARTAAQPDSDYTRFATARIIKEVANQIRDVAKPYIGEANTIENRNALSAALDKRLGRIKEDKVIENFFFEIVTTAQMELMGEAMINASIKAPTELRNITTTIGLTA